MAKVKNNYDEDFYTVISQEGRNSAQLVLPLVFEIVRPKRILDVGAGAASWSKVCSELGAQVLAIDGSYVPESMREVSSDQYLECDLTKTWPKAVISSESFDLSICLEVAEHIPHENSDFFIQQLCKTSREILFSAAIPYQGGTHHLNENWISYWDSKFESNGFRRMDLFRSRIWDIPEISFWYRQNLYLFVHKDNFEKYEHLEIRLPNDLIHPELYLWSIHRDSRPGNFERDKKYRYEIQDANRSMVVNLKYGSEFEQERDLKWRFLKKLKDLRN